MFDVEMHRMIGEFNKSSKSCEHLKIADVYCFGWFTNLLNLLQYEQHIDCRSHSTDDAEGHRAIFNYRSRPLIGLLHLNGARLGIILSKTSNVAGA